jgi:acylphosphatase
MMRLTAYASGNVQKVGYRARIAQIANSLKLKGIVENLSDGRVKIVAEGDEQRLRWFEEAIDIRNSLIRVASIEKCYSEASNEFSGFYKLVGLGETDSRLDQGVEALREILAAIKDMDADIKDMNKSLGGKMDQMLDKQDELLVEVKDINKNLNDKMDRVLDRTDVEELKHDMADVKAALRAKGIF